MDLSKVSSAVAKSQVTYLDGRTTPASVTATTAGKFFTDSDSATSKKASRWDAFDGNKIMYELVNCIRQAGLTPDDGDWTQVWQAILIGIAQGAAKIGDVKTSISSSVESKWLSLDGSTIGNTLSTASRKNDLYQALYAIIWNSWSNASCPVSGGRGANATSDWSANKTIAIPDFRGRTIIGAGQGINLTNRVFGSIGGEEAHTLTVNEVPALSFSGSITIPPHTHTGTPDYYNVIGGGGGFSQWSGINGSTGSAGGGTYGFSGSTSGGGQAHNNLQPFITVNYLVYAGI